MGYFLILIGLGLLYYKRRRTFNRRNMAGVEEFRSFEHSVGSRGLDIIITISAWIIIISGIALISESMKGTKEIETEIKTQSEGLKK